MTGKKRKTTQEDRGSEQVAPAERPNKRARVETQKTTKTRASTKTPLQPRMTRARFKAHQADETQEIHLNPGLSMEPRSRRPRKTRTTATPPMRRNASCDQDVLATVTPAQQPQPQPQQPQQQQQDVVEREYEMTTPVAPVAYMGGLGEEHLVSHAVPVAPVQQQQQQQQETTVVSSSPSAATTEAPLPSSAAYYKYVYPSPWEADDDKESGINFVIPELAEMPFGYATAEFLPVSFPTPWLDFALPAPFAHRASSSSSWPDEDEDEDKVRRTVRSLAPPPSSLSAREGVPRSSLPTRIQLPIRPNPWRLGLQLEESICDSLWSCWAAWPGFPPPLPPLDIANLPAGRRGPSSPCSPSSGVSPRTIGGFAGPHFLRPLSPPTSLSEGGPEFRAVEPGSSRPLQTQSLTSARDDHRNMPLHEEGSVVSDGDFEYGEYLAGARGNGPLELGSLQQQVPEITMPAAAANLSDIGIPGLRAFGGDGVFDDVQLHTAVPIQPDGNMAEESSRRGQQQQQKEIVTGASGKPQLVSLQRHIIDFPPWPYHALPPAVHDDQYSVELNDEDPLSY